MNHVIASLAVVCGFQQQTMLDVYGNQTCRDAPTGATMRIEGSPPDCPTGTMPRLTEQGPACVGKDDGSRYFNIRRDCPLGTVRKMNERGNDGCWPP